MNVRLDSYCFSDKPLPQDIAGIKNRLSDQGTIVDLDAETILDRLCHGQTVQPGVTLAGRDPEKGLPGTLADDWVEQTLFLLDFDNREGVTVTPEAAVAKLAEHNIPVAFAYPTFSSGPDKVKFRLALVSDQAFTDRAERDRVQRALCKSFYPQADPSCTDAGRMFFGTDKAPLGVGDLRATCAKEDLLKFADWMSTCEVMGCESSLG